ncbi:acetylornithine deacetylase/succinyl-diaminopimelate desuccinylase-like protein [Brevibacillus nitrificans]|nr:M20/M25/M40 family metallo-hydrolase [Brevibacillus nitrificans]MDR7317596.1 acetylornithine deacetylase/succinyl-diaminopimelate desuccinylase-like protein [Brevibacillus nitrificans]
MNTPFDHKIIQVVTNSEARFGQKSIMEGNKAVSDATFYSNKGIPSVGYGPIGGMFHGPDEFVDLDSLVQTTKVLMMSVLEWQKS